MNTKLFLAVSALFISQISSSQSLQWAKSMGGATYDYGNEITIDASGNVYTVGSFEGSVDFDPGAGVTTLNSAGGIDIYIQKSDPSGNFLWAISMGSTSADEGLAIVQDGGDVIITGSYNGTVDFDPTAGVTNLTAVANNDVYVAKYNSAGNLVWVVSFGGTGFDGARDIAVDGSGNIYTTGFFNSTVDFDPGAGTDFHTSTGSEDAFIQKLNSAGNLVWAETTGEATFNIMGGRGITVDASGNVIMTGYFAGTVDFDPNGGTFNLTATGAQTDAFVQKLDASGNFVFAVRLGSTFVDNGYQVCTDAAGNVYAGGNFMGSGIDLNTGPGTELVNSLGTSDNFIIKLDALGNYQWGGAYGGTINDIIYGMSIDASGFIYVTGFFSGTVDFDMNLGIQNFTSIGGGDAYLLKIDGNGNFISNWQFGGIASDAEGFSTYVNGADIYFTGRFNGTIDADPASGVTTMTESTSTYTDIYIIKIQQDVCANLTLIVDSTHNIVCATGAGYVSSVAINGLPPYTYSWNTIPVTADSVAVITTPAIYTVTVQDANGCIRTSSALVNGPTSTGGFDLDINLINTWYQMGFPSILWLDVANLGCLPSSGQASIVISPCLSFTSSIPSPDLISGDTLTWNLPSMTYDSAHFQPVINVDVLTTLAGGCEPDGDVANYVWVTPIAGDFDTTNNVKEFHDAAHNAYDPNHKSVYPRGECDAAYVKKDEKLTYTIVFQNTGTANAINVYLIDSLSNDLDISTLTVLAKSHSPMVTEILPGNVVKFRFDNIQLPDSSVSQELSHGFVVFKIMPNAGAVDGSVVSNEADIYFDFNPEVTTNSVSNTLVATIPTVDVSTTNSVGYVSANASGLTYQWVDCDNNNDTIPGATSQGFSPLTNGNYAVWVSDGGCTELSACESVIAWGIHENDLLSQINVYPNPSNGLFNIDLGNNLSIVKLELIDITGRLMLVKEVNGVSKTTIQVNDAKGIYYLKITADEGQRMVKLVRN